MRMRLPSFDFSQAPARWIPRAPEMAQLLNAHSIVIPHLERFLNRVMARARAEIKDTGPKNRQVREDISVFIKQESCHHTIHAAFNEMMVRQGYDRLPQLEQEVAAHYDRLLRTKPLPFLVAYCEGFESMLPPIAAGWFDGSMDRMMKGADTQVHMMWRWHMMEEFEHRTVCHDAFHVLHGGFALRLYGYVYQAAALEQMVFKVYRYLLSVDRKTMNPEETALSKKNARRSVLGFFAPVAKGMKSVLRRGYNPADIPEPKGWAEMRDYIESDWLKRDQTAPAPV